MPAAMPEPAFRLTTAMRGSSALSPAAARVAGTSTNCKSPSVMACRAARRTDPTMVDLTDAGLTSAVCPPPPEEADCEEDCGCITTGSSDGGGSASAAGGGASSGGSGTGPGVHFFYKAGGIGRPGQPGSALWGHGR